MRESAQNVHLARRISMITALLLLLLPAALAQGADKNPLKSDKPIEITSERMRSENGGEKIIFSGNVVGIWGDLKITSNVLEIRTSENKQMTDEIVAIGNVVITRDQKRATGDKAVYLDKQQQIILTGSPHATAWEDQNIIEGREMIFLLDKDRFVVNDRVKMKFYPQNDTTVPDDKNLWVDAKK
jgi:lipopolysaccharide export system protein LptA